MNPLLIFAIIGYTCEFVEKGAVFSQARAKANQLGKPLLNAGCGNLYWEAIYGSDVNLDNKPRNVPRFVLGSIEDIPYPDKYFGVVFCSHVLEHTDNWHKAYSELNRVADYIYIIVPKPIWVSNWLNLDHKRFFIGNEVYERTDQGWRAEHISDEVYER